MAGIIISVDNSFKIGNKASVVDKGGTRLKVWKGGILSVINERNLIIAWVSTYLHLSPSSIQLILTLSSGSARVPHPKS